MKIGAVFCTALTALTVIEFQGEARIDSRLVAKRLDIQHHAFMQTLRLYHEKLEELGVLAFEMPKPPKGSLGGRPETYVMLNEDQAIFAGTLSRNTRDVVDFKLALTRTSTPYARSRLTGSRGLWRGMYAGYLKLKT